VTPVSLVATRRPISFAALHDQQTEPGDDMAEGTQQDPIIVHPWAARLWVLLDNVVPGNQRQKVDDNAADAIIASVPEGKFFVFGWDRVTTFQYGIDRSTIDTSSGSYEKEVHWVRAVGLGKRKVAIRTNSTTVDDFTKKKTWYEDLKDTLRDGGLGGLGAE
jgi:hypothetical protein